MIENALNVKRYYGEKHSMFKLLQFFKTQLQLFNSENFTELFDLGTFFILALKQTEKLSTKYR